MRTEIRHQAWIGLAAVLVFFTGLGGPRLWDDDEPRNSACAREMMNRGDWIVPTFNFELRTDKPVLVYWLMMGSYALFGATEFAARLPSALLAVGTSLLVYHLGRLLFRSQVGLWAGLVMATNLMFSVTGRAATPDSTLIFCTTLALLAYVWSMSGGREGGFLSGAAIEPDGFESVMPRSRWSLVAIYGALGLAVLAKGPVGVVLPVACLGLFVCWVARRSVSSAIRRPEFVTITNLLKYYACVVVERLQRVASDAATAIVALRPKLLVLTVLAVAAPWYLWVSLRTNGEWLFGFLWKHNIDRFMEPMEGHRGSIFFHLLALAGTFFPWSFFLPPAVLLLIRRVRQNDPSRPAWLLIASWCIVWFGVFSLAGTKLPNYVLPAYPALALAVGAWIAEWIASPSWSFGRRWLSFGWAMLAVVGVGLTVALTVGTARWLPKEMYQQVNFGWIGLILLTGAGVGWFFHQRMRRAASAGTLVATTVALFMAAYSFAAAPLSRWQSGPRLAEALQRIDGRVELATYRIRPPGAVYYSGQKVDHLNKPWDVRRFFDRSDCPLLVTDAAGYEMVKRLLPDDVGIIERQSRFPKRGEVVLVGELRGQESRPEGPAESRTADRSAAVGPRAPTY